MRFSKTIEVVLGLAASGGIVLGLSGSAFAADSGTNTNAQSEVRVVSQTVDGVTTQSGDGTTPTGGPVNVAISNDKAGTGVIAGSGSDITKIGTTSTPTAAGSTLPKQVVAVVGKVADAAGPAAPIAEASEAVALDPAVVSAAAVVDNAAAVAAVAVQNQTNESVIVNSVVLPIQPRITTARVSVVEDLAAHVPSAPVSNQSKSDVPAPAAASGLFGRLTAVLAGSVVPSLFTTPVLGFVGLTLELTLLLIVSFLALRSALNLAAGWIRRGGFAHAARSDVGQAVTSIFATPFVLSYADGTLPMQSSFLMVADKKPYYSWFPTLSERRK